MLVTTRIAAVLFFLNCKKWDYTIEIYRSQANCITANSNCYPLLHYLMGQPSAALKPYRKYNSTNGPICKHTDPHGNRAKSMDAAKVNTECYSEQPHADAGEDHGKAHISCCPHAVGRNKSKCPYNGFYDCDPSYHVKAHLCTLRFHAA